MRYIICGASSRSGRAVARSLAALRPMRDIVMMATSPEELDDWSKRGARVVYGGYNDRASLDIAFAGGGVLMLNNCLETRSSADQHRNVIEAAQRAGVAHILYTSSVGAHPSNPRPSVATHVATERMLWESGMPFTIMRNQLYSELTFHWGVDQLMLTGRCYVLGDGWRYYAPVCRADIAECAASILTEPEKHDRVVYEITGPERLSMHDLVRIASDALNMPVICESITEAQMREMFESGGVSRDGSAASMTYLFLLGTEELVKMHLAIEQGFFDVQSSHVQMILGRPPTRLEDVFRRKVGSKPGLLGPHNIG